MPLINPAVKQSVSFALGERPMSANGGLREPTAENGGKPSHGMEAWHSISGYMPSYAHHTTPGAERLKFAGLFWKDLMDPKIVGFADEGEDPMYTALRWQEPRALTRFFSNPAKDYRRSIQQADAVLNESPTMVDMLGGPGKAPYVYATHLLNERHPQRYGPIDKYTAREVLYPQGYERTDYDVPGFEGNHLRSFRYPTFSLPTIEEPKKEEEKKAEDQGNDGVADDTPKGPPNFRMSDMPQRSCHSCVNYQEGQCTRYSFPTQPTMVCDDWEMPNVSFSGMDQPIQPATPAMPEQPMQPMQPGETMDLQPPEQEKMSQVDSFKYGFLLRCAEEGLSEEETSVRVKQASALLEKQAIGLPAMAAVAGPALGLAGSAAGAIPGTLGLGLAVGGSVPFLAGTMGARFSHDVEKNRLNKHLANNKINVQDFQNLELINEYRRMNEELKRKQGIQDREEEAASKIRSFF